jgi:membrane-bound lytic murein transglycosylase A
LDLEHDSTIRRFRLIASCSGRAATGLAALLLAACANTRTGPVSPRPAPLPSAPAAPGAPTVARPPRPTAATPAELLPLASLPGWWVEDHAAALALVQRICAARPAALGDQACADALRQGRLSETDARAFLETRFRAQPVAAEGLLTGYFAPTYEARARRGGAFSAPVRPLPPNPAAAADRAAIARWPTSDALAWMRPEDLFFLQVQGSGVLIFPDGMRLRAVYAGSNSRPFVAIARNLIAEGRLAPDQAGTLHAWLAAHRGPKAAAAMDEDPRYIFFRLEPDDGGEPRGASGLALVPGRSLAIDPAAHAYGELLWIDAEAPTLSGARPSYQRLTAALDTGSAITGPARADLYIGRGEPAGEEAARVRHTLWLYRLVPAREGAR